MGRNILLIIAIVLILPLTTIFAYAAVIVDEYDLLDGANVDLTQIVQLHMLTEFDTFTNDGIAGFAAAILSGNPMFDMIDETNDFFATTSENDTVILTQQGAGTFRPQVILRGDNGDSFTLSSGLLMLLNLLSSFHLMSQGTETKLTGVPGMGTAIVFSDSGNEAISFTVSRFPELITAGTLYTVEEIAIIMAENKELITGEPYISNIEAEVIALSATETIRDDDKDVVVTVTYRNISNHAGTVSVELLYGGAVYISENITFNGTAGQTITRTYIIRNLPLTDRSRIEARINYGNMPGEGNPDNNTRFLAPLYVPIPQNDFSVLFIQAPEQVDRVTLFTIRVAFKNDSYFNGTMPVQIIYNGQQISRTIVFSGTPFETIVEEFTVSSGFDIGTRSIEARINWHNRVNEENPENNSWTIPINVLP